MPIGVFINVFSVAIGSIAGALAGNKLPASYKENLNMVFGVCAVGMGISSIVLMENMPAVIFAIIFGTTLGLAARLGKRINAAGELMQRAGFCCWLSVSA